jgi:hypothetical protein
MFCRNCGKEIVWEEGKQYIDLSLKVLTGHEQLMPIILGDCVYCLDCFMEVAGERFIPERYVTYKDYKGESK